MSNVTENIMKDASKLSLQLELLKMSEIDISKIMYQPLPVEHINLLSQKIDILPFEYRNILFFRYCFNYNCFETDKILEIENSLGKLRYVHKMLSDFMGLKNLWIDDKFMKEACHISLAKYCEGYDKIKVLHKTNYSYSFRRKLKDIKIVKNPINIPMLIVRIIAVFILICAISFSTVLAVNAEIRENFFD